MDLTLRSAALALLLGGPAPALGQGCLAPDFTPPRS